MAPQRPEDGFVRLHLNEVFVRISGEKYPMWRAVDHKGEVLEVFVSRRRDCKACLKFLRKLMKRYGRPDVVVTERLRFYGAAMKEIGTAERQKTRRPMNNRAETSQLPFRPHEGALPADAQFA